MQATPIQALASSTLRKIEQIHCMHVELHREDYTVAKLDWHVSAVCQMLLGVTKKSKSNESVIRWVRANPPFY